MVETEALHLPEGLRRVHGGLVCREGVIDFSASINPLGPPRSVVEGLTRRLQDLIEAYPDPSCRELKGALSRYTGVAVENILPGNGSTHLIYLLVRALRPGKAIIVEPSFTEYRNALILSGARIDSLLLKEQRGFSLLEGLDGLLDLLSRGTDMVFLANPSSPRGELLPLDVVREVACVAEREGIWLVVDEAFIDFSEGASFAQDAVGLERAIVVRSMTKFFSLPGLRLGYVIAHKRVIEFLSSFIEPWSVNGPAQLAGVLALEDQGFPVRSRRWLGQERGRLFEALSLVDGLTPLPSDTNFLLIRIDREGVGSSRLQERLFSKGIYIRDCSSFYGLDGRFFRIAILGGEENDRLVEALRETLEDGTGWRDAL